MTEREKNLVTGQTRGASWEKLGELKENVIIFQQTYHTPKLQL